MLAKIIFLDGGHFDKVTLTVSNNPWRRASIVQSGQHQCFVTFQMVKERSNNKSCSKINVQRLS